MNEKNKINVVATALIEQTAHDYDLPVWVVKKAKENYPNNFYDRLEEILIERRKSN